MEHVHIWQKHVFRVREQLLIVRETVLRAQEHVLSVQEHILTVRDDDDDGCVDDAGMIFSTQGVSSTTQIGWRNCCFPLSS